MFIFDQKSFNEFSKGLKLYFSSLSGRGAKYAYFNISGHTNSIVLSNGDYELLLAYRAVTLGVHVITFHNSEFLEKLKQVCNIPNCPYVIKTQSLLALTKIKDPSLIGIEYDSENNLKISTNGTTIVVQDEVVESIDNDDESTPDTEEESEESEVVDTSTITFTGNDISGTVLSNAHALYMLEDIVNEIYKKYNNIITQQYPVYSYKLTEKIEPYMSNYIKIKIPISTLDPSKEQCDDIHALLIDGLDLPVQREFLKNNQLDIFIWMNPGGHLQVMSHYEDSTLSIFSHRPFMCLYTFKPKTSKEG